jgi:hypothetical protein
MLAKHNLIIANSCLAKNFRKKLNLTIDGNGALPITPDSGIDSIETNAQEAKKPNLDATTSVEENVLYPVRINT